MKKLNVITWNVNGLKSCIEKGDFNNLFDEDIDFLCIQEVKNSDIDFLKSTVPSNYYFYYNLAQKNGYSGVAIYSKYKPNSILTQIGDERFDNEGRIIVAQYEKFSIVNLYMPHGGRDKKNLEYKLKVAEQLIELIKEKVNDNLIICTDFNIAHTEIDLSRPKENKNNIMFTAKEREIVNALLGLGLKDTFREKNSTPGCYTWFPYAFKARERNLGWRIDYIFSSKNFFVNESKILHNIFGSDHCPLNTVFKYDF